MTDDPIAGGEVSRMFKEATPSPMPASVGHDDRIDGTHFRLLGDALPHIVWATRPDGQADYLNRRWHEYTGLTPEQSRGFGWLTALPPEEVTRCRAELAEAARSGAAYEVVHRVRGAGGDCR